MFPFASLLGGLEAHIGSSVFLSIVVLLVAFAVLAKCADLFVESAVATANRFNVPKLVIGIVLVSFATTMPELMVSLIAALEGSPEMAMGNAIGSVIVDDGFALAAAGFFSVAPIAVLPKVLKTSGLFLLFIQGLAFIFVLGDHTLSRPEGAALVAAFGCYLWYIFRMHRRGELSGDLEADAPAEYAHMPLGKIVVLFLIGLAGIILSSKYIVVSATCIARSFGIPEAVIALTLVALGTSIPEIATCIMSARKGHGEIAVGNIIGADILNICWVAGVSSIANDLTLSGAEIWFMFPAMFLMVGAMLLLLRCGYTLTRRKGMILFALYIVYVVASFIVFPPERPTQPEQPIRTQPSPALPMSNHAPAMSETPAAPETPETPETPATPAIPDADVSDVADVANVADAADAANSAGASDAAEVAEVAEVAKVADVVEGVPDPAAAPGE